MNELPLDADFTTFDRKMFDALLGQDSLGDTLWDVLRSDDPWGIGPTTASKLMARKRPALIPIYDSDQRRQNVNEQ